MPQFILSLTCSESFHIFIYLNLTIPIFCSHTNYTPLRKESNPILNQSFRPTEILCFIQLNISGPLIKPFQGLFLFLSPVLLCLRKFSVTVCSDSCLPLCFTHLTYSLLLICWKWFLVFYPARFLTPMYQHIHTRTLTL